MQGLERSPGPHHLVLEGRLARINQPGHVAPRCLGPSFGGTPPSVGLHQCVYDPYQDKGVDQHEDGVHRKLSPFVALLCTSAQSRAGRPTTNKAMDPWPPRVTYVGNRGDVMGTGSHHGEAPWHGKLEGPAKPGNCVKIIHSGAPAPGPSTSQRDGSLRVVRGCGPSSGELDGR